MKFFVAICFFLLGITYAHGLRSQAKHGRIAIDTIIEGKMEKSGIVGLGAAIIVDKKLVWSKGYGYADADTKKPFTTSTIMNIGSIPKNFTGACIMKAVEEKKLSLDDDINKHLPFKVVNPNYPAEKITLRNLATHTSSLADRHPFYGETYNYDAGEVEELGSFLRNYFEPGGKYYSAENFLNKKPGTYYQYSNIPAALAGYVVEQATGKTLQEYGMQYIFKPLGMTSTAWSLAEINLADHSSLYERKGDTLRKIPLYTFPTYPEGGIRTCVSDLVKYFSALLNEGKYGNIKILKATWVKEMMRFQFDSLNKPENMNLQKLNAGIFWATKLGATRVGHNGSDPGVRTFMLSDLSREIAVVLFINTSLDDEAIPFDVYDELYKYGKKLKEAAATVR
jgi:CubicO group peptidase (beta-lactamase class C family)